MEINLLGFEERYGDLSAFIFFKYLKIQRTDRKIQQRNSMEPNGTPDREDGNLKTTSQSAEAEAATVNTVTPAINKKILPRSTDLSLSRSSPQNRSCEFSQSDLDHSFQSGQFSMLSGGYENSRNASVSSLASSDVFTDEPCTTGMKKYASVPWLRDIEGSLATSRPALAVPYSKSASSLEHCKNEIEISLNGVDSTGRKASSGGNSPFPPQRKISSNRNLQVCSGPRRRDSGFVSLFKGSPRVSRSDFNYESQEQNNAYPRFYRAMYTYNSQDDGEVAFREGDEVEVIRRSDNGWWLVRTSEELGWGPSNFLQSLAY